MRYFFGIENIVTGEFGDVLTRGEVEGRWKEVDVLGKERLVDVGLRASATPPILQHRMNVILFKPATEIVWKNSGNLFLIRTKTSYQIILIIISDANIQREKTPIANNAANMNKADGAVR